MSGIEAPLLEAVRLKFANLSAEAKPRLRDAVAEGSLLVENAAKAKLDGPVLHRRSGALQASIRSKPPVNTATGVMGVVGSFGGVPYAAIHEFGGQTAPHEIRPVNASVLAFQMGGRTIFAKVVHHPGSRIPARPYLRPSLTENAARIRQLMTQAVMGGR